MALLRAKQLNINEITNALLNSIGGNYTYNYEFANLVDSVHTFSTGYHFPSLVNGITPITVNANSASIKWNPVPLAVSYNIYCHPKGNILDSITMLNVSGTSTIIIGLTQDTIYEVQVTPNLS